MYFVEPVSSADPIDFQKIVKIEEMTQSVNSHKIYITAFVDFNTYGKCVTELVGGIEMTQILKIKVNNTLDEKNNYISNLECEYESLDDNIVQIVE